MLAPLSVSMPPWKPSTRCLRLECGGLEHHRRLVEMRPTVDLAPGGDASCATGDARGAASRTACTRRRAQRSRRSVRRTRMPRRSRRAGRDPPHRWRRSRVATSRRTPAWIIPALRPLAPSPSAPLSSDHDVFPVLDELRRGAEPGESGTDDHRIGGLRQRRFRQRRERGVVPPEWCFPVILGERRNVRLPGGPGGRPEAHNLLNSDKFDRARTAYLLSAPSRGEGCSRGRHPHR